MKNYYLVLLFLFSFGMGFAQTKDSLSLEEQQRRKKNIQAGNPFKKFGYKPKISTLSKGKYLEFHDLDSIVQIGSFTFHVKKKVITGYIVKETKYSEATLRPEIVSRWFSPDPLSDEFPSWSPYNFTYNNPVFFTDPTGLAAFAFDNDYGLDDNGNITLIKETDDNFDRLYAIDEKGNKKDTNADGSVSENDAVTVNDQSILPSLSNKKSTETKSGAKNVSYAFTQNSEDAFNIFTFAANNSSVEWGLNKYRNTSGDGSD